MSFPRLRSLRSQLLLAGLLFQCLLLAGYFLVTSSVLRDGMRDNLQVAARQTAEIINLAVAAHASDGRLSELQDFFRELIGDSSDGLTYLLIEDERGQRLLTAGRLPSGPLPEADSDTLAALDRGILHQRQANFNRMAEAVTVREKKFAGVFNAAPLPMLLLRQQ
ncbi:MAG: hypothetical protein CFE49_15050, partial [Pseudomonas sp. PGPPP3]